MQILIRLVDTLVYDLQTKLPIPFFQLTNICHLNRKFLNCTCNFFWSASRFTAVKLVRRCIMMTCRSKIVDKYKCKIMTSVAFILVDQILPDFQPMYLEKKNEIVLIDPLVAFGCCLLYGRVVVPLTHSLFPFSILLSR